MQTSMEKLSPYFETYCGRIKHRRLELGMTLNELSEKSGVPYSNVSRINSGSQANPLLFNSAALADTMGMSLNEIMGLSPDVEDSSALQDSIHDLELSSAKKDAELNRLRGDLQLARDEASHQKEKSDLLYQQLSVKTPVIYVLIALCVVLSFALVSCLIIDANIRNTGLIQFGNLGFFAWILVLILILSAVIITAIITRVLIRYHKSAPNT
jgi:transcriptional regulator with XRE-family HTH domain